MSVDLAGIRELLIPKLTNQVARAKRMVRRAALAVETTTRTPGGDVQAAIEDLVRAGTVLEQAEQALAGAR